MKGAEILPGRGFGPLRFGMTRDDVEAILGPAPESEFIEDGQDSYLLLQYPENHIALFLDSDGDLRLRSIEIERSSATLFGEPLFPKDRGQILRLLETHLSSQALGEVEEERVEFLGSSLWVPSLRGTFYFDESGELEEFHWSPFFGADDEIIWPDIPSEVRR